MPQLPEETSPEGQPGKIPAEKALKGTKYKIQLQFNPTGASVLPAVQHRARGREIPQHSKSTCWSLEPLREHLLLPSSILHLQGCRNSASSETPGGMKHFQSLPSWGDPQIPPGCSPGAGSAWGLLGSPGLVWQHNRLLGSRGSKSMEK